MTVNINCLVMIIVKDAVQFKIKHFDFFTSLNSSLMYFIYMYMCCKLSKCIGQTPCSYEHYLVCSYNKLSNCQRLAQTVSDQRSRKKKV